MRMHMQSHHDWQEGVKRRWCSCMMHLAHALVSAQSCALGAEHAHRLSMSLTRRPNRRHAGVRLWEKVSRGCAVLSRMGQGRRSCLPAGRCSAGTAGDAHQGCPAAGRFAEPCWWARRLGCDRRRSSRAALQRRAPCAHAPLRASPAESA